MTDKVSVHTGRHFLQIPGPTNVPDRVLRAMSQPVIDHRGPEFARLAVEVLEHVREVFQTSGPVVIYPCSGTGGCEAAFVNTLSPADRILICETGWFSHIAWRRVAERLGLVVDDLMLAATLSGVEMGFRLAGVPHSEGGVAAALHQLVPATCPCP
jgi:alanine-glyoxylate transaminase/serine-glyoxylate transaminase/serine-pyruvate transaminase